MHLPWTIWRQTFVELWRLFLITAGVLVTVISFAVSVILTAQGKLGPVDTVRYMFYAMPPMMQFALPFAAGFAATLTYHRMSQDNELTAAAAGGVSHRVLLIPALVTGLLLAGGMSLLLDEVVPRFFKKMEGVLSQDAARMVETPIASGQPLEFGPWLVHADNVHRLEADRARGVFASLLLNGVFGLSFDKAGQIRREMSATQAVVEFSSESGDPGAARGEDDPESGTTHVAMRLINGAEFDPEHPLAPKMQGFTVYMAVPRQFDDNPKFRTTNQLLALPAHPDLLRFVDAKRRELAVRIAERASTVLIDASLRGKGSVRMTDDAGRKFTIRAAGIAWRPEKSRWELTPIADQAGNKAVAVTVAGADDGSESPVRLTAQSGGLQSKIGKDSSERALSFDLVLERVAARIRPEDPAGERVANKFDGLIPTDQDPLPGLLQLSSPRMLAEVEKRTTGRQEDPFVTSTARELRDLLRAVGREIVSKYHERWASCVAALVMVLAGALTAMRLGSSLPLTVYLWSFFPALTAVLTISAGQQMAHKVGMFGLVVLWGGVAVLAAYTAGAFMMVRRH